MTEQLLYYPGVKVWNKSGMEAVITAVCIYLHGGILYEVAWWIDGVRYSAWLSEWEFDTDAQKVRYNFITQTG